MKNSLKLCALFIGTFLIAGCGQKNAGSSEALNLHISAPKQTALHENDPVSGNKLVKKAKSAIGTPYVLGGSAPGGFDCSGLVKWAYNSVGVKLPRTAREQSVVGKKVKDVKDMRAGDIVAFRHPKRGYHTGIYVGDGKFVHSPRKRTQVRINSLSDPYFRSTLIGARRVKLDGSENLIAQSEERLRQLVAEKSTLKLSARNLAKIRTAGKKNGKVHKTVAVKSGKNVKQSKNSSKKKSTIASQARKIKSVASVTGSKRQVGGKNGEAHSKLANASKKASHKTVSPLAKLSQKVTRKSATTQKNRTAHKAVSMLHSKSSHKKAANRS